MKFNENESEIEIVGEVQSNKVSIDTSNINFIVTILSSNLYSNPIQSFIRETVSNAWDSHVEAGVDKPVVLELGTTTEGENYCKIQDFGVGLSPERFENIYKNIGSSTKRADNTQIGGFGIGRFSALAYSDVVHITSNYNGTEYVYMMYKEGNSVSIDLLNERETDADNGVSVRVPIKPLDVKSFMNAILEQLVYFENLYLDTSNLSDTYKYEKDKAKSFNELVIKKYRTFSVASYNVTNNIKLTLGKVTYPIRLYSLKKLFSTSFEASPITVRFNIGDLEVTPNREEILYTDKNIAKIEEALTEVEKELEELIESQKNQDFTSLKDYVNAISNKQYLVLLKHPTHGNVTYNKNIAVKATYNGESYDVENFREIYKKIFYYNKIRQTHIITQGSRIESTGSNHNYSISLSTISNDPSKFYFCAYNDLSNYSKQYIRERFPAGSGLLAPIKSYIHLYKSYRAYVEKTIVEEAKYSYAKYIKFDVKIFKLIFKYFLDNLQKLKTFSDKDVPKSYIDDKKAEAKAKRALASKNVVDWKQNMNIYPLRFAEIGGGITFDTELMSLENIGRAYRNLVIYDERNSVKLRTLYKILGARVNGVGPVCIEVAPTKMKNLKNLSNFISLEEMVKKPSNRLMRNLATAYLIKQEVPDLMKLYEIENLEVISPELSNIVKELQDFQQKVLPLKYSLDKEQNTLLQEIYESCKATNNFNFDILGKYKANEKLIEKGRFLINFAVKPYTHNINSKIPEQQVHSLIDYIMSRKLFIPNRITLQSFRDSQQPKPTTNESNQVEE